MNYWKSLVKDFIKEKVEGEKTSTSLHQIAEPKKKPPTKKLSAVEKKQRESRVYIGAPYEDIYFTHREAQAMALFLKGYTNADVADRVKLSARTIEYYLSNMKAKLACKTKNELMKKIADSEFGRNVREQKGN